MNKSKNEHAIIPAGAYDHAFAAWLENNEQKQKKTNYLENLVDSILRTSRQAYFSRAK